jgi:serine/threonine protein kinase
MLDKTESGAFSDFWALGVILYEMACGRTPFLGRTELVVFDKILRRQFEWPASLVDDDLKSLIDQLLQLKPQTRLGMQGHDALKSHPFFEGVNWEGVKNQTEPIPAHDILYDPEDPTKVISFTLIPGKESSQNR